MAVPKKKTSKSRRNMRRAHNALKPVNAIIDQSSGEYRRSHQIDPHDGTYNGKIIVMKRAVANDDEDQD